MFWTSTKRIVRAGFVNFWRNRFVSLASMLVMVITLLVVSFVLFVGAILGASLQELESKVDVNVYFVTDAPEQDVLALQDALDALPEVASVEYVTREEALQQFEERHADDELILQGLAELDDNPLGAVLNVSAQNTKQYESIARFLESDEALGADGSTIIDRINFFDNENAIDALTRIIDSAEQLGFVISIVLAIVSVIITFNTIRLAIYTAREEISVMRLVGASHMYIRGPFVIGGMLYGAISGIITLMVLYPLTYWLGPTTVRFFGSVNVFDYFVANFGQFFLIMVVVGIVLGGISTFLAVARYLRV